MSLAISTLKPVPWLWVIPFLLGRPTKLRPARTQLGLLFSILFPLFSSRQISVWDGALILTPSWCSMLNRKPNRQEVKAHSLCVALRFNSEWIILGHHCSEPYSRLSFAHWSCGELAVTMPAHAGDNVTEVGYHSILHWFTFLSSAEPGTHSLIGGQREFFNPGHSARLTGTLITHPQYSQMLIYQTWGIATLDHFPDEKSLTASWPSHCGVIFSSLRMVEARINWGSGLE